MNIVLFGPPGSGKGTQGEKLVKEFNLVKVSAGDLLREEIKKNNPLGIKIKPIVNKGLFVSDDIINNLIEVVISNKTYTNRIIFDGYPRNLNQRALSYLFPSFQLHTKEPWKGPNCRRGHFFSYIGLCDSRPRSCFRCSYSFSKI